MKTSEKVRFQATYICKKTEDKWEHFLWNCHLETSKGKVLVEYKMGKGHCKRVRVLGLWQDKPTPPKVEDVLNSLLIDNEACNASFEDWCGCFGYEEDSRKALELYLECQKSGKRLMALFNQKEIECLREELADY